MINNHYFLTSNTSQAFKESIEDIKQMPDFFSDAINWGIDASYAGFGFMVLLSLAVKMFNGK